MFKRVLVLVLFLFGVFWWLTNPDNEPTDAPTEVEVVETEESAEEGGEKTTEETEAETENTAATETESTEEVTTEVESTSLVTPTTDNTSTPAPVVTQPVSTPKETTVVSTPVVTPVRTAPVVPARITDIKVFVYEWGLDLSDKTIPAGTINFQVQNDGRFTHDFSVSGFGNLGKIAPSETRTFTIKLTPGEYEVFSDRRQDYERGIVETFTVVQ